MWKQFSVYMKHTSDCIPVPFFMVCLPTCMVFTSSMLGCADMVFALQYLPRCWALHMAVTHCRIMLRYKYKLDKIAIQIHRQLVSVSARTWRVWVEYSTPVSLPILVSVLVHPYSIFGLGLLPIPVLTVALSFCIEIAQHRRLIAKQSMWLSHYWLSNVTPHT